MNRRTLLECSVLWSACLLTGCTVGQYARMLIKQDTTYGKVNEAITGSSKQLIDRKAISAARRYTMPDGVEIDVWIRKAKPDTEPLGTVLVLHGLCDSKATHLKLGQLLSEKGFDVVLPDLRAHGRSTGEYVTFGALEKQDQKRVMDALLKEKVIREPLYVFGADLGGSVAILYAAIDPRVQGVMAVAPSRDMRSMCRRFFSRNAILLNEQQFEKVIAEAGQIGRFDPSEASALDAAPKLRCPLLLVHSKVDLLVDFSDSQALHAAAGGPKELEVITFLDHFGVVFGREPSIVKGVEKVASGRLTATTQPAPEEQ
ncbi:MAG: hypothetical protein AMJ81_04395 [Phycisphaerae bacterium SM23_33]|nr:MAG: hypothetical protein AMJ81_04395 [Phycisphaerae bacterium SM23_33]